MWLQQDGMPHVGRLVVAYLNQQFPDYWISQGGQLLGQRDHQVFCFWTAFSKVAWNPWCMPLSQTVGLSCEIEEWTPALISKMIMTVKRAVTSTSRRVQLSIDDQGGHFESCK
jgi:hypothetical protein